MTRFGFAAAAGLMLASYASSASAFDALGGDCGCSIPLPTKGVRVGEVSRANDDVLVSGRGGLVRGKPGAPLKVGSRVIVGPNGSAQIALGASCNLSLRANSTVDIARSGEMVCVTSAGAGGEAAVGRAAGIGGVGGASLGAAGAAAAAIFIAADNDDKGDAPPVSLGK
ncbi:hypothetical protein [Hansschlegelia plantiphila]|uniref:hypothetical protein n=1 Tax=Hansschlegelia plantiphila TaxID=374655 RepID=UPI0022F24D4E|nr:hypothetical protein [Hansschlegelia plantiphila]